VKKILLSLLFGLLVCDVSALVFTLQQAGLLGIVAFLVAMWTCNGLPLGVVSLLPVLLFPAFGIMDMEKVAPNYAKSVMFLFLGGFMVAIAMQKSGLHVQVSRRLLRIFPHTPCGIIYAMAVVSAVLSSVLSNTTITLMLMPIGLFLTDNVKLKVRILLAIAYGASIGGIFTPIGTPPNLILLGYLESIGMEGPSFGMWMGMTAPVVCTMLLVMPWVLSRGLKGEEVGGVSEAVEPYTPEQRKLIRLIGVLCLVLLLNTPVRPWWPGLGLNEKGLLLAAGVALFLPYVRLLSWEDTREIPWEILFLFGAGFSIASAFGATHLAEAIAGKLAFVHSLPLWMTLAVIALVVSFATEITSNTALTAISLPVMAQLYGPGHPATMLVLMVATVAASYAFMLPIATPPNAIIMSSRCIKVPVMARFGIMIDLLGVAAVVSAAYFIWRWALG